MPDRVTVTSRQGFFSRLSASLGSIVFGLAMFLVGFPLLFWNEGRAVRTAKSLEEGAGVVTSISPDRVEGGNDGRLVHVSGTVKIGEILEDETFGVSAAAVKLVREVEMYQWVERQSRSSETKLGGSEETTTTYDYATEWRSELVDSSRFQSPAGHENPGDMPYVSKSWTVSSARLGAFELSPAQMDLLRRSEPLEPDGVPHAIGARGRVHEGAIYLGADPARPAVGDARVRFRAVRPGPVSVVARQVGATFEPYRAAAGGSVFLLEEGTVSADGMFESAEAGNTFMTWVLRGVGFFVMFLGLGTVLRPIAVAGDVVPVLGRLLGAGTGAVALLGACFFTLVTVGIAWLFYRPLVGLSLLGLGVAAVWMLGRRSGNEAIPATPPPLPSTGE